MPTHYQASFFPSQAVALQGYHYRPYGRFCALPSRHALGKRVAFEYKVCGHWHVERGFLDADICGTPGRVDLPRGTFFSLFGAAGVKRGLIPIRLLSVSGRARHSISRNSRRHGDSK